MTREIVESNIVRTGDVIFFGADKARIVNEALGALRVKLGEDRGLVREGWAPLWVVDFPMFEWDERESRWTALHHPFTAPALDDPEALVEHPADALSKGYDMVLNGAEIGGGLAVLLGCRARTAAFLLACFQRLLHKAPDERRKPTQPRAVMLAPTRELAVQLAEVGAAVSCSGRQFTAVNYTAAS